MELVCEYTIFYPAEDYGDKFRDKIGVDFSFFLSTIRKVQRVKVSQKRGK